jgi:hypothetical protein
LFSLSLLASSSHNTLDFHYHATLAAGEETLEVSLARLLMRSVTSTGGVFDQDHFRDAYVAFMTTPGKIDGTSD